jgi:SAM-dependent methyltransferase
MPPVSRERSTLNLLQRADSASPVQEEAGDTHFLRVASVQCPICSGPSSFAFRKLADDYFRCHCGFLFIWPRPGEEYLQDRYRQHGEEYWSDERVLKFTFSPSKSRREIRFLRRFSSGGKLLDIGCSTGSFVRAALDAGFDAEGVDISSPAITCGKKLGLPLRCLDVLNDPLPDQYDIVSMWATLEHLPDPMRHLKRARDLLRPGGLLLVSVPNFSGITQKLIGKWDRYVGAGHLNYFTPHVLRFTLETCGMHYRAATTYGFNPIVIAKDFRNRGRRELAVSDLYADINVTLRVKESPAIHLQWIFEGCLNIASLGDVVAMCASNG